MPESTPARNKTRKLTAHDLFNLRVLTSVAIDPGETRIAYTVERMDQKENKYFTNIFVVDIRSGESRQFTHGNNSDRQPVWSPDGGTLAFVSTRDQKTGIYLISSTGGSEKKLIELDGAIANLQWTPDGRHLLFAFRYNDSHAVADEKKKKEAPVYRHITRLWYRLDGEGFLPRDRFQVYTLDVESCSLRSITKGRRDNVSPALSPDGKWVAFASNRSRNEYLDSLRHDLRVIPFAGGEERRAEKPAGPVYAITFSPDSKTIAYLGHDNPNDAWGVTNTHVWTVGIGGRPRARDLLAGFDRHAYDGSISDLSDVHNTAVLYWSGDGKRLFFLSSDTGATNLYSVPRSGGKPTRIFKGKCHLKGLSIGGRGQTAARGAAAEFFCL